LLDITLRDVGKVREILKRLRGIEGRQVRQRSICQIQTYALEGVLNCVWIGWRVVDGNRKSFLRVAAVKQNGLAENTHVRGRKEKPASGAHYSLAGVADVPCQTQPRCNHLRVIRNRYRKGKS